MAEDWQLASVRNGLGRETPVNFTVAGGQVLAALAKRIAIIVYPPAVDAIVVSFRTPVDLNAGCRLVAGSPPLVMTIDDYGPLVTQPLYGRTTGAANQTIGIVEVGNTN
jgi:hypothetical protein